MFKRVGKKGQMAIFVIVALVIVAGILVYFLVKENSDSSKIPAELASVYSYYDSCIEEQTRSAIDIAGTQGGHIYVNNYDYASDYAPFSSQLDFMGFPVPYWYYVSGNGIIKEQVPTKNEIEEEISKFVVNGLKDCNFDMYYAQGYEISVEEKGASTKLSDNKVSISVNAVLSVSKGNVSASKSVHDVEVSSKFGKFYGLAREIYDKEKNEGFLENYSVDVLYLYAPVDGVEIGCSPKIWKTQDVINDLKEGLSANIAALKFSGEDYELQSKESKYFVVDQKVDENVNAIYSSTWPTKINIVGPGVDDSLMVADTIGNQQGLGIIGFCYAPYHFVYDVSFPVMLQIYDNEELFQFPVAVVIDKNMPRNAFFSEISEDNSSYDICAFKTQDVNVNVYDSDLTKLDAELSYSCLGQKCSIGKTEEGAFSGKVPACVNGYLYARAENYSEGVQVFSSNTENNANFILDKEYNVKLNVNVNGEKIDGPAVVLFSGVKSVSASIPEIESVMLAEGEYNVSVYVYGNSSITLPESKKTQCVEVGRSGLAGLFGGTKEQCFDVSVPATKIESALLGGGKSNVYLLSDQLKSGEITLNVDGFKTPESIEDLQYNYEAFEQSGVEVI